MIMLGAVQLFEAAGFEALVAFSSDEAVAHLESRSGITVAFIEYDMSGSLSGAQLAEAVRNGWPTIEIIVVSRPRAGELPDLPLGARYFEKPYTHSEINRALDELGLTGTAPRARANQPPRG